MSLNRMRRWAPLAIFLLAFGIRGLLLARIPRESLLYGELTPHGLVSLEEGINVAVSLLTTGKFADPFPSPTGPTAHLPPAFPAATAVIFWIFGTGLAGAIARNLLNIAGYGMLFALLPAGAEALAIGRGAGVVAGFAGAIYPAFRSTEVFRGRDEWLAALMLLGLTVFAFRLAARSRWRLRSTLLYGLGWGALMYVHPGTAVVFPLHLAVLVLAHKTEPVATRFTHAAAAVLVMLLTVLPWTIRNRAVIGGWFFMRDNLGLELAIANGDGAQPSQAANQATRWFWQHHPMGSPEAAGRIRTLGELEFNRRALHEARAWISQHPEPFARLTLERIAYFWMDIPSNPTTFFVRTGISLLCWAGIILMWRRRLFLQVALLGSTLLAYPLVYHLVQYSNRYVATLSFALLLPAGYIAIWLCEGTFGSQDTQRSQRAAAGTLPVSGK
jgi:hypothetical protein